MSEPHTSPRQDAEIIDLEFRRMMSDVVSARPTVEYKQAAAVLYFAHKTQVSGNDTYRYEMLQGVMDRLNPNPPFGSQCF